MQRSCVPERACRRLEPADACQAEDDKSSAGRLLRLRIKRSEPFYIASVIHSDREVIQPCAKQASREVQLLGDVLGILSNPGCVSTRELLA